MTIAVDLGRKATKQTNKKIYIDNEAACEILLLILLASSQVPDKPAHAQSQATNVLNFRSFTVYGIHTKLLCGGPHCYIGTK